MGLSVACRRAWPSIPSGTPVGALAPLLLINIYWGWECGDDTTGWGVIIVKSKGEMQITQSEPATLG